jgi:hypothetical protein
MARPPKQLQDEIDAALTKGTPHPAATVSDWKRRLATIQHNGRSTQDPEQRVLLQQQLNAARAGLRAAQSAAARKPTYVTDTNLFALKDIVVKHGGPTFPGRVPAVYAPHLKRTVAAGLVEVVGNAARLTTIGRKAVTEALEQDLARVRGHPPRENPVVPPEKRAEALERDRTQHEDKIARLEVVLSKLS